MKNVLVACEFSGTVRDAFIQQGFNAVSCDILPTESPGPHYQMDVIDLLHGSRGRWDLMIAHPPCTYLANSGVRWLYNKDGTENTERWRKMRAGARFFRELWLTDIPHIAVENPVMHRYAKRIIGAEPAQSMQPWQFGHGECKRTCLWLKNLPPLQPTDIVDGREQRIHRMAPSEDRQKLRSVTYAGIANAMAKQWGEYLNA